MALILEDGTGLVNSNSYVSLAEAEVYFTSDLLTIAAWEALPDQENQLIWATRVLDQKVRWRGTTANNSTTIIQALRWPRQGMYDRDHNAVSATIVPIQVKQATCEMAKWMMTNDVTAGQNVDYLKMLKVDVIELMWQDRVGQPVLPALINEILAGLGSIASGGARFVPIAKT